MLKKNCNLIIWLWFGKEIEKQYGHEVKKLYKSSEFELIKNRENFGILYYEPLKRTVSQAKAIALLLTSLILSIRPTTTLTSTTMYLLSIKLVTIFVVLLKLAYQNNSNYIPLFITMYLYLTKGQVDVIIFLNYLSLLVLCNVFLRKLRNITTFSATFIKK